MISRIAKEGRKYGVTLCLVSQRPSELAIGSLAQCNTVFALRLTNEHDQAFVARALPENARWLVESLPSLNTQEAVVVGDGVTVPVHIRFNDLDPRAPPVQRRSVLRRGLAARPGRGLPGAGDRALAASDAVMPGRVARWLHPGYVANESWSLSHLFGAARCPSTALPGRRPEDRHD